MHRAQLFVPGFSTKRERSGFGLSLARRIVSTHRGWIEVEPFPEDRLRLLEEASFNKKRRVLEELEQVAKKNGTEPYLKISQAEKDFLLRAHGPGTKE